MNTQSKIPVWNVQGLKLELDLEDAITMERYEHAFMKMKEEEKLLPKDGFASQIIRPYCEMYFHLYDNVFKEGTSQDIFKGTYNARLCDEVYESFLTFISEYSVAVNERRNAMTQRFSVNREQRRTIQKKRK